MPPGSARAITTIDAAEAARRLKAARVAAGWTSAVAAARACGIHPRDMQYYEAGDKVPAWPKLLAWAVALGLDPRILFPELFRRKR
jgi:transcriptional regulator with XRE-family HTH domain